MTNRFSPVLTEVQGAPTMQRAETLIKGVIHQLQQSGNPDAKQLGQELQNISPQLIQACNQTQATA